MFLSHFIEKLDDICEVHIPVQDDVPVVFNHCQSHEEKKLAGNEESRGPNGLPDKISISIRKFSFEIQEKPPNQK